MRKKIITSVLLIMTAAAVFTAGFLAGRNQSHEACGEYREERETFVDTVYYPEPVLKSELSVGIREYRFPATIFARKGTITKDSAGMADDRPEIDSTAYVKIDMETDSLTAGLPVVQRHYVDSCYEAWVSGPVDPQLDSLKIYASTTVITREIWKPPKRWHISINGGYGLTPKGFLPYIGFGASYTF